MRYRAQRLVAPRRALVAASLDLEGPGAGEIAVEVSACGVCRTDLHIVDGELAPPRLPLVPGHEIVGRVAARGAGATRFALGERVGIPWLAWTCGECEYCREGRENLCERARFTGFDRDGGYAERVIADERFALALPPNHDDLHAAPLLCAGLIGYRAFTFAGDARRLGLYGFGAAAHIVAQVAESLGREVYAFTRPGDRRSQQFARDLGCAWAGDSDAKPPVALDAAILFAPVGALVPRALESTRKGGRVICAGIHMSDIPAFPYRILWGERSIRSVANLTRDDGEAFMRLAATMPIETAPVSYALDDANRALDDLRRGAFDGAAVLTAR
ncbi:MAG: zinc-dependent alcohol dehydrogenase family protein [Bacillota bacterium]